MGSLLLLIVLVPLSELYLLYRIGSLIGLLPTLALLIGTAFAGYYFAKREGVRVWIEYQRALSTQQTPPDGVLEGLLVLLGGVLLIVPGVITDVVGLMLLIPWSRRRVGSLLRQKVENRASTVFTFSTPKAYEHRSARDASVVDTTGESEEETPPRRLLN